MQCYELVDDGMLDESKLNHIFENIAGYIRCSHDYVKSELNKISF